MGSRPSQQRICERQRYADCAVVVRLAYRGEEATNGRIHAIDAAVIASGKKRDFVPYGHSQVRRKSPSHDDARGRGARKFFSLDDDRYVSEISFPIRVDAFAEKGHGRFAEAREPAE